MVTYRGWAKSNRVGTQYMQVPSFKREHKRDSKKASAEAYRAMAALLEQVTPDNGATAFLEFSDARGYVTTLAKWEGFSVKRDPTSGRVLKGGWRQL